MVELLIIKAENDYYRFDGDSYFPCELSKASVFSLDEVESAKTLCKTLWEGGIATASLVKLTIIEEPYLPD